MAIWSLRLRPVCSLAPTSPAISVTRRSTAVWMSSSSGLKTKVPGVQLPLHLVEGGQQHGHLVGGQQAPPPEAPHVGPGAGQVVEGQDPVVVRG